MTARRADAMPGTTLPSDRRIAVTRHAIKRLRERFPHLGDMTDAEAAELLTLACQTGRVLRWRDAAKYFAGKGFGGHGISCYSHDLGGIMVLAHDPETVIVKTVFRRKPRERYADLFDQELN